jgi:tetratricopeptide (TPR) repeat protein
VAAGLLGALLLSAAPPGSATAADQALARGDQHWALRAAGAQGAVARTEPVDAALAAYREAAAAAPQDLTRLARLLRALHYRGSFCGLGRLERRAAFEEGRDRAQAAVVRLEATVVRGASGALRLERLRATDGAALIHFWAAVHWGEWSLARGQLAAAREGAGGKIRDLAQTVIDLDPALERGGGYRVLGRLHDQAPRIPLLTGWVSRRRAVELLQRALEHAPDEPMSLLFLGEALLDHVPARRDEALRLLRAAAEAPPRPGSRVEDAHYAALARARLAR